MYADAVGFMSMTVDQKKKEPYRGNLKTTSRPIREGRIAGPMEPVVVARALAHVMVMMLMLIYNEGEK